MVTQKETVTQVSIRPEVTILSVLKHLNYKPWFALAEFVDNSIQSYQQNRAALEAAHGGNYKLRVEIDVDRVSETIAIRDNAAGILAKDFPRAFRPAELPIDRSGLSEFGMGMKSAACWFTDRWQVRTKAIGDSVERVVNFDIESIIAKKSELLAVEEVPGDPQTHYTEVRLMKLGDRLPQTKTWKKLRDHLASIYREFLRSKAIVLVFEKEELHYEEPEVLKSPHHKQPTGPNCEWRKTISFDFGLGQSVTGFAALRKVGSTTHAGFALFRRGRLIEGSGDETYRPQEIFGYSNSYRYQRLFGELHLNGFEVSHTKDGFRWNEDEETFLSILRDHLTDSPLDLLDQAEGFRTLQNRKTLEMRAVAATENVAIAVQDGVPAVLGAELTSPSSPPSIPDQLDNPTGPLGERMVHISAGGEEWNIVVRCILDPSVGELVRIAKTEEASVGATSELNRLEIELNLGHPFARNFNGANGENTEMLARNAAALCLSEVLAAHTRPEGMGRVLFHFNEIIRRALSGV